MTKSIRVMKKKYRSVGFIASMGAIALGVTMLVPVTTYAIPPGGPGSDTPGTSCTVTGARTVQPGGTVIYRVTGYPAGEIVHVKVDDGQGYGADTSIQGSGVVATSIAESDGTSEGSVEIPNGVSEGNHWLRFLASQKREGAGGGVLGYTCRGDADFTITSGGSGGTEEARGREGTNEGHHSGERSGRAPSDANSGNNPDDRGNAADRGDSTNDASAQSAGNEKAEKSKTLKLRKKSSASGQSAGQSKGSGVHQQSAGTTGAQSILSKKDSSEKKSDLPMVGILGAILLVFLGGGAAFFILRKSPAAATATSSGAASQTEGAPSPEDSGRSE